MSAPDAVRRARNGRPRRRLIEQVRREEPNCWLCGKPIDLSLPPNHPMGSTVDELVPLSLVEDPRRAALTRAGCRHAHRSCNSSRGNGTRVKRGVVVKLSRVW